MSNQYKQDEARINAEMHNHQDTIANLEHEVRSLELRLATMQGKVNRALEVADEETVYRCGGKPKHIRMAEILRGKA